MSRWDGITHANATVWTCTVCKETKPIKEFYRIKTLNRIHAKCRPCYRQYKNERMQKYPDEKARGVQATKEWRARLKELVIEAYGGKVCSCCGETELGFLQIDHIDGGGNAHRRSLNLAGTTFLHSLKKAGFPPGYRVLCANCNWGRRLTGVCPHEEHRGN